MKKLLIICDSESEPFAQVEAVSLEGLVDDIAVYTTTVSGKRLALIYPLVVRREARKAIGLIGDSPDIVVGYGGRDAEAIASRVAASEGAAMVRREDIAVEPSIAGLNRAERHCAADHALTFVTADASEFTQQMMRAIALGRTGSKIEWRPLERVEATADSPANLIVNPAGSLSEAVDDGPVDWYVDFRIRRSGVTVDTLRALSAGVPVAIVVGMDGVGIEIPDECGIMFAPDVTKEEFVRGMLPFIESDYRSEKMSEAAYNEWRERWNPLVTTPEIALKLSL